MTRLHCLLRSQTLPHLPPDGQANSWQNYALSRLFPAFRESQARGIHQRKRLLCERREKGVAIRRSEDEHRITIAIKTVSLGDRFAVGGENPLTPRQGH
jgi:hypothetical protein